MKLRGEYECRWLTLPTSPWDYAPNLGSVQDTLGTHAKPHRLSLYSLLSSCGSGPCGSQQDGKLFLESTLQLTLAA